MSRYLFLLASFLNWKPRSGTVVYMTGGMVAKALIGALALPLALLSALAAVRDWQRRRRAAALTALAAALTFARHIACVVAPHDGFASAFGPDWEQRIPVYVRGRLLQRRWPVLLRLPAGPPARWRRDVVFGDHNGRPLLCDLWRPPVGVPGSGLGLVYLHGSAWHYVDKDYGTRSLFRHLARQGHTIMDVAYTMAPATDMGGMVGDAKRAVAWLREQGPDLGVDPERIVLMGGSAGGHLALLAAYTAGHPELPLPGDGVRGVVACYGFADLAETHEYFQPDGPRTRQLAAAVDRLAQRYLEDPMRRLGLMPSYGRWVPPSEFLSGPLGGDPQGAPDAYMLFSPLTHVGAHCPPTLLLQGAHDSGGMAPQIRRLRDALCAAGVPVVHVEFPATEHAFDLVFPAISPVAQAARHDLERFLGLMAVERKEGDRW